MFGKRTSLIGWLAVFSLLILLGVVAISQSDSTQAAGASGTYFSASNQAGQTSASASIPSKTVSIGDKIRQAGGNGAIGMSAIKPQKEPNLVAANVATFADTDVRQFAENAKLSFIAENGKHSVKSIEFLSSQEASKKLDGESIGLPDSSLVCLVVLEGSFSVGGPSEHGSSETKSSPVQKYAHIVFDAHTGNILVWGIGDKI
jgi:hypothetical protein